MQPGLYRTRSETLKTGFLTKRLICYFLGFDTNINVDHLMLKGNHDTDKRFAAMVTDPKHHYVPIKFKTMQLTKYSLTPQPKSFTVMG